MLHLLYNNSNSSTKKQSISAEMDQASSADHLRDLSETQEQLAEGETREEFISRLQVERIRLQDERIQDLLAHNERLRIALVSNPIREQIVPPITPDNEDAERLRDAGVTPIQRVTQTRTVPLRRPGTVLGDPSIRGSFDAESEIEEIPRTLSALHTPASTPAPSTPRDDSSTISSQAIVARARLPTRAIRVREPDKFYGKNVKESRDFLNSLALFFALSGSDELPERERVLYGASCLAGDAKESWHNRFNAKMAHLTWAEFETFVKDTVGDPVNRMLGITLQYEKARQKDNQSAPSFALELELLENQIGDYSEEQKIRTLLTKLNPDLRSAIVKSQQLPKTRQELVALATRIETVDATYLSSHSKRKTSPAPSSRSSNKRSRAASHRDRRRQGEDKDKAPNSSSSTTERSSVTCWGCKKPGHLKPDCPSKHLWAKDTPAVRRTEAQESGKAEASTNGSRTVQQATGPRK